MSHFPLVLTHIFVIQSQVYKVQKERLHTKVSNECHIFTEIMYHNQLLQAEKNTVIYFNGPSHFNRLY